MKQLVQLRDAYAKLKQLDTEIIGVFREEKQGREGLTKIRNSTKVKFALVEDLKAEKTGQYSRFYNYVIDKQGVVQAIVGDGAEGRVGLKVDTATPISGRDVIIVEDIVATGLTLSYLLGLLD